MSTKTANVVDSLDAMLTEIGQAAEKRAAEANTEAGGFQGATTHPVKDVDDRTDDAQEGARSSENESDVKADQGTPGVDSTSPGTPGGQDSVTLNIGTSAKATGEDSSSETSSAKGGKDDPGTQRGSSTHPARTDNDSLDGHKYADLIEKAGQLEAVGRDLVAAIAVSADGEVQKKAQELQASQAAEKKANEGDPEPTPAPATSEKGIVDGDLVAKQAQTVEVIAHTVQDAFNMADKTAAYLGHLAAAEKEAADDSDPTRAEDDKRDESSSSADESSDSGDSSGGSPDEGGGGGEADPLGLGGGGEPSAEGGGPPPETGGGGLAEMMGGGGDPAAGGPPPEMGGGPPPGMGGGPPPEAGGGMPPEAGGGMPPEAGGPPGEDALLQALAGGGDMGADQALGGMMGGDPAMGGAPGGPPPEMGGDPAAGGPPPGMGGGPPPGMGGGPPPGMGGDPAMGGAPGMGGDPAMGGAPGMGGPSEEDLMILMQALQAAGVSPEEFEAAIAQKAAQAVAQRMQREKAAGKQQQQWRPKDAAQAARYRETLKFVTEVIG